MEFSFAAALHATKPTVPRSRQCVQKKACKNRFRCNKSHQNAENAQVFASGEAGTIKSPTDEDDDDENSLPLKETHHHHHDRSEKRSVLPHSGISCSIRASRNELQQPGPGQPTLRAFKQLHHIHCHLITGCVVVATVAPKTTMITTTTHGACVGLCLQSYCSGPSYGRRTAGWVII